MKDIRGHREQIYANTDLYMNELSNQFQKPMKYDIGIWSKDDPETPFEDKNCIILKIRWD